MGFISDAELERWKRAHSFPPTEEGASPSYWRESARIIIDQILLDTKGREPKDRLEAIDKAYPFGERKGMHYHQWLLERREVLVELGLIDE